MNKKIFWISKSLVWSAFIMLAVILAIEFMESIKEVQSELVFSILVFGVILGAIFFAALQTIHKFYLNSMEKMKIENHFKAILQTSEGIKFTKRIEETVFFSYHEYTLVMDIKTNVFYLFLGKECLLISTLVSETATIYKLREFIWSKFSKEINDVIVYDNIIYSRNLATTEKTFDPNKINASDLFKKLHDNTERQKAVVYDIDEILDKINKSGIESLTPEELKFLKNQS